MDNKNETPSGDVKTGGAKAPQTKAPQVKADKAAVVARIIGATGEIELLAGQVVVICRSPGFRRASRSWKALEVFAHGKLTQKERKAIAAEPLLELIELA